MKGDLSAQDLAPENGVEITRLGDKIHATFHYDWDRREHSYDGAGVGDTLSEAVQAAIADAEMD